MKGVFNGEVVEICNFSHMTNKEPNTMLIIIRFRKTCVKKKRVGGL